MKNIRGKIPGFVGTGKSVLLIFAAILLIYTPMAYSAPPDAEMCA